MTMTPIAKVLVLRKDLNKLVADGMVDAAVDGQGAIPTEMFDDSFAMGLRYSDLVKAGVVVAVLSPSGEFIRSDQDDPKMSACLPNQPATH